MKKINIIQVCAIVFIILLCLSACIEERQVVSESSTDEVGSLSPTPEATQTVPLASPIQPSVMKDILIAGIDEWPVAEVGNGLIVLGKTSDYPEGCSPREVAELILRFFEAYNAGEIETLKDYFGRPLQWYSDTKTSIAGGEYERLHFAAYNLEQLWPYFAARHQQNDTLQLLMLHVSHSRHDVVDMGFVFRRQANDLQSGQDDETRIGNGKGSMRCPGREISTWSMGLAEADADELEYYYRIASCTHSFAEIPEEVVVCARESN